MGNCLCSDRFGAAENCAEDNWAAEYAKKLFDAESLARKNADEALDQRLGDAEKNIGDNAADIETLTTKTTELGNDKVDKTQYASTAQAGIIKLNSSGAGNNSGLIVNESTGVTAVNIPTDTAGKYGLRRDNYGQIQVVAATQTDIDTKMHNHKPIVPAMLSYAVQSVTGKFSNLKTSIKTSLVEAINEIKSGLSKEEGARSYVSGNIINVGTWVDECPIWRVAFPLTPMSAIGINAENKLWTIYVDELLQSLGIVNNGYSVVCVNERLCFQNAESYNLCDFAAGVESWTPGVYHGSAQDIDWATHFYGWVEFACEKSNLIYVELPSGGFDGEQDG